MRVGSTKYFFILLFLALPKQLLPQNYGWTYLSSVGGNLGIYNIIFVDSIYGWCTATWGNRTTDGGKTWTRTDQSKISCFIDHQNGWNFGWGNSSSIVGKIWRTNDSGKTWILNNEIYPLNFNSCSAKSEKNILACGTTYYNIPGMYETTKVVRSNDGGITWQDSVIGTLDNNQSLRFPIKIQFIDSVRAWFLAGKEWEGDAYLYWTRNAGRTWKFTNIIRSLLNVAMTNPSIVFLDTLNGYYMRQSYPYTFFRTMDGGVTWDSISSIRDVHLHGSFFFSDKDNGWINWERSTYQIYIAKTNDGGRTWIEEYGPSTSTGEFFMLNKYCGWKAIGRYNLYKYGLITSADKTSPSENNFQLFDNYPNPFNSSTVIEYELAKEAEVELSVYSLLGQEVKTITRGFKTKGRYKEVVNLGNLPSGMYFCQLKSGNTLLTKSMTLIK